MLSRRECQCHHLQRCCKGAGSDSSVSDYQVVRGSRLKRTSLLHDRVGRALAKASIKPPGEPLYNPFSVWPNGMLSSYKEKVTTKERHF